MANLISVVRGLLYLCRKEFLAIVKDPANRVILIAPAIVQTLLFGYGATYDLNYVPYAVLDQSNGTASRELLARFDSTGVFQRVETLRRVEDIARVIDGGDALLVLHMGPDFEERLAKERGSDLQLILDGRNSTTAGMAAGHISRLVGEFNARYLRQGQPRVQLEMRAWFNPNLETRWNIVPGLIAALSMIQTLMLAALSVAREREQGTFDQLLVTPLTPLEILIGKAVPSVLIGLLQSTLILAIGLFWFRIPMAGSLLDLYLGLLVFTTACVGIGLSVSALSANMQQAMVYTFVIMMPLILLSGLITPIHSMPETLQILTYADPLRFAIDLVRRVYLEGASLADISGNFIPMLSVAAVTLPLAAWLFRNRLV
ncbi:ABC transporter permease [Pseudomonas aeruginosa]|uniref:ABC transporter permease n=1 Tax=Pseudomonas aeruginosa TaxID=287 RepID=UPI000F83A4CF|nr:ABC transporter permease [Pseudomonas aeruginosa]MCD2822790.1 ABC transporter permease [Pseudomonas aeruginosa]MCD2829680.1 ABC transporter permease [Pseudomonas aeruginosa]MCS8151346.1 ABC transporter permease [Pseudomonas aeruginosa]RTT01963.1 ABC transporter permease [Pseudomonas aeruginosa]RUI11123.1 ABC transporter permease [Pseudomonas aeruginosa]